MAKREVEIVIISDALILINRFVNWCLEIAGRGKMSFSKRIKAHFKDAIKFINNFEITAAELAIDKGYSYVICGHIHQPEMREIITDRGRVLYLNSGDWVESLTALEFNKKEWKIFKYNPADFMDNDHEEKDLSDQEDLAVSLNVKLLFEQMKADM